MSKCLLNLLKNYHKEREIYMTKYEWFLKNFDYSRIYAIYECNEFLEVSGDVCGDIFRIRVYGDNETNYKMYEK